jgi:hypothetical protein
LVISLEDKGLSIQQVSRIQSRDREPHKQENRDLGTDNGGEYKSMNSFPFANRQGLGGS